MANQFSEIELFEGKNYSDLLKEIYDNSVEKRGQIAELISSLTPLIEGIGDATLLVPLVKEYLEIGVKNDEQLVKLAQLIQRVESSKKTSQQGDMWDFTKLLEESETIAEEIKDVQKESEVVLDKKV